MNALSRLKSVVMANCRPTRYAASFAFGYGKGYLPNRGQFNLGGQQIPLDAGVGVGLLLASGFLNLHSRGLSKFAPHLNAIADAGIQSWLNSKGAAMGGKASGKRVYVLAAGSKAPAALPPGMTETVMGHIPQAGVGTWLNEEQMRTFSRR